MEPVGPILVAIFTVLCILSVFTIQFTPFDITIICDVVVLNVSINFPLIVCAGIYPLDSKYKLLVPVVRKKDNTTFVLIVASGNKIVTFPNVVSTENDLSVVNGVYGLIVAIIDFKSTSYALIIDVALVIIGLLSNGHTEGGVNDHVCT